jgi:hypothetical protein
MKDHGVRAKNRINRPNASSELKHWGRENRDRRKVAEERIAKSKILVVTMNEQNEHRNGKE